MAPANLQIRTYQADDEPSVIALWQDVLADDAPHNNPKLAIRKKIAVGDDLLFVALLDSAVVGTVMGGYDGHRGWIYSLAVSREFQRQGIATALMSHLEKSLAKLGCLKINLQVRATNEAVIEFYEKRQYQNEARVSMGKRLYDDDHLHMT